MTKKCIFIFLLFIKFNCRIIIPFKYLPIKNYNLETPKEIMSKYISEKIYINLEIGSPKQEVQIPIKFDENILYIQNNAKNNNITSKKFDDSKSNTFKTISESVESDYEHDLDFNMFHNCSDIFYFLENSKKNKYNSNIEFTFRYVFDGKSDLIGGFGLQIYPAKGDENNIPCHLKIYKEKNINNNYVWSIFFTKEGNNNGDEGYLLLGDYPHNIDYNLGFYDPYEFDVNNYRTILDHSSQKIMNYEIQMTQIYFYNKKGDKDKTDQHFFNDLNIDDFINDIIIPQVSVFYVTKFDFNFGGILIPEYFNAYLEEVFNPYIKEGKCFIEKALTSNNPYFFYCKKEKSLITNIKTKIPTILFEQDHLKYNFTLNINDLIYEKNDYVYFLLLYSTNQRNKWTLGKPFLKKYPFVFNPDMKDIGFYSSFLLTGIKYKTVFIIVGVISLVFIIIGVLIGRKKYKINKIKKQQALEMTNNSFSNSYYKSIEMNEKNLETKLYNE
jgi:hypothetical protein